MAGLDLDRNIPAALAEVDQHLSSKASLEKRDLAPVNDDDDSVHDGLEFPTAEELVTLRRVSDALPWTAYMIAVVELAERFSYYGASAVFVNFIQQPLPSGSRTGAGGANGQSGALGGGQQLSTGLTTFYQFWSYICPIAGAYIADTYWGRYKTICWSVVLALLGHVIMIISAIPGIIGGKASTGLFLLSLIITGTGAGGFKSNISPLVAEQYRRTKPFVITTKSGERVIVDPIKTTSRIYMYFYLFINIGALIGQITMVYAEKFVGYWLAFMLPTIVFFISPLFLWWGHGRYRVSPPTGSVLGTAFRVWRYALRGRWSWNPVRCIRQLTANDFWESAKPSKVVGEKPEWMKFDDNWVDEIRRGFKACSVFAWYPIYWLCYNQLNNNLTSQAATMNTHGLPNDILSNLDPFALIIFIPICDLLIYPALAKRGWKFTALKKVAWGFATATAAMIWATVVQYYIYKTSPCGDQASTCVDSAGNPLVSPLNVWIQTGSYVLIAFSEIFASITGLEYAFTKAPKNMRSLVMSLFLFTTSFSAALGEAWVSLSIDPLLVWNYGSIAVLAGVTGIIFWLSVRKLDKEEDTLNNLTEGQFGFSEKDQVPTG
ncbi:POT family-domain-containing protein [Boletus reticuloceps]|uniref:POT family-domain-containing protein n=1 Tax=Boletus reticuloceps TaxID=495285 RepID=A0A8I3A7V0_9AGAM|nr:POT family-domain-containing protein [Boletus reticuloceps]